MGQLFPKKYFLFLLLGNHIWIYVNVTGSDKVSWNSSSNIPSIGVVSRQFRGKRFADSRLKKKRVFKKKYWNKTILYMCDSRVPILYHESKSIPCVLSIPWFHVYTMSLCQYHESMSIPWVQKFQLYKYKNTNCRKKLNYKFKKYMNRIYWNTEITIIGIQKYTLQKYKFKEYRNTNYKNINYRHT